MNVARDAAKASGVAVAAGFDVLSFVVFVVLQPTADKANSSNRERTSERTIISHLEQLILARQRQYSMQLLISGLGSSVFDCSFGGPVAEYKPFFKNQRPKT